MSILEKRTYDSQGRARTAYRYVIAVDHPGTDGPEIVFSPAEIVDVIELKVRPSA